MSKFSAPSDGSGDASCLPVTLRLALAAGFSLTALVFLYSVTGITLGLFFGGFVVIVLLLPLQVGRGMPLSGDLLCGVLMTVFVAATWGIAGWHDAVTAGQWCKASLLLASVATLALGVTRLLVRWHLDPTIAGTLVILTMGLWFTWPVWLASVLLGPHGDALVDWLTPAHPLFAMNGLLSHLGIWTQMPIAYRIMNLNQDVLYALPETIWPAVLLHGGIGSVACVLSRKIKAYDAQNSLPAVPAIF